MNCDIDHHSCRLAGGERYRNHDGITIGAQENYTLLAGSNRGLYSSISS